MRALVSQEEGENYVALFSYEPSIGFSPDLIRSLYINETGMAMEDNYYFNLFIYDDDFYISGDYFYKGEEYSCDMLEITEDEREALIQNFSDTIYFFAQPIETKDHALDTPSRSFSLRFKGIEEKFYPLYLEGKHDILNASKDLLLKYKETK